jgi:hypothetical protein
MARRLRTLLPIFGIGFLALGALAAFETAPASAAGVRAQAAPLSYAEGDCVGTQCAPPNGALPGLTPPRLPFAEPAAPCDGTEPEFTYPQGNPQLDRTSLGNPALRRTYSWYRNAGDDTPVRWGKHCDIWWAPEWSAAKPVIVMPAALTADATVPVRLALPTGMASVGSSVALPSITVPRKAPDEGYVVMPVARLTDVRWVGSENCTVTPLPNTNAIATVKVTRPFDPTAPDAPACVSVETSWDLTATRILSTGPAAGTREAVTNIIGSQGQSCGATCVVEQRTSTSGTVVVAEGGLATPEGERLEAAEAEVAAPTAELPMPTGPVAATVETDGSGVSAGFAASGQVGGFLAIAALFVGIAVLFKLLRRNAA